MVANLLNCGRIALRRTRLHSAERGAEPQYGSTQEVFRRAARGTEDLTKKIQRIAELVARHGHGASATAVLASSYAERSGEARLSLFIFDLYSAPENQKHLPYARKSHHVR